jgi:hypothetical protein
MSAMRFVGFLGVISLASIIIFHTLMVLLFPGNGTYLPNNPVTYVFEKKVEKELTTEKHEYIHFEDGFVQVQVGKETRFYYADETGVYHILTTVADQDPEENQLAAIRNEKRRMVLKLPAKQAESWESEGQSFEIVSTNEFFRSDAGIFSDVVKVRTTENGVEVFHFYHKDAGLIRTELVIPEEEPIVEVEKEDPAIAVLVQTK